MNKIYTKKLKRKKKLIRRLRCHGSKDACLKSHLKETKTPIITKKYIKPEDIKIKKTGYKDL